MSKTTFATNNALTKKAWEETLFRDVVKKSYLERFRGDNSNALVHSNTALTKQKGDVVNFGIRMRLAGAGVTSGQTLEGNEESLTTHSFDVALERYRHGVRDNGALDRQRAMFSIDSESELAIKDWGTEKLDELGFDAILNSPTRVFYSTAGAAPLTTATEATAKAALTANSVIFPKLLSFAKTWAMTGGNRSQTPLRPIKVDGKKCLVLLIHPDVGYDLRSNSEWFQAMREAMPRGSDNPIFRDALGMWNNVIIHEHENVTIATDAGAGSNVPWAKCVLMGAQALCEAWGKRPSVVQENFDYQEEHGYAIRMTYGVEKPVFNSKDFGSVGIFLARTQISDAS